MNRKILQSITLSALVVAAGATLQYSSAQVRINEFLADNVSVNPDLTDVGDFSDWIELYNDGSAALDLSGYYLTDDLSNPKRAAIPSGTSIASKGYLLFWADSTTLKPGQTGTRRGYAAGTFKAKRYHIGFKLSKKGEQVGLYDGSKFVDSVTYGQQFQDVSMGRASDGSWAYFDQPTPGSANSMAAKKSTQFSGTVTFSEAGGFYSSAQSVTLTASDGSDIYYTTDGTIPYAGTARKYSGAISVSANTPIRARCIAADKLAGTVFTNTYFVNEKARKLMVVNIATDPNFLNNDTFGIFKNYHKYGEVPVTLEFFTTDGKPAVKSNAGISVGTFNGNDCPQKPLQVAVRTKNLKYGAPYIDYDFFERPFTKYDRLRLRQGSDAWNFAFINDDLADAICNGQSKANYQAYKPVVAYINGKYDGLRDLREQYYGRYFEENYGLDSAAVAQKDEIKRQFTTSGMMSEGWQVQSGSWSAYASMMQLIKAGNYANITAQIDVDSKIDWICVEAHTCNESWGHNEDFWKVPNSKWRWLISDLDRSFNYQYVTTDLINGNTGYSSSMMTRDTIFAKLMAITEFKNHFLQRFAAHLNSTFKPDRLNRLVDSLVAMLVPEMTDQAAKWGSQGGIKSVTSWKSSIDSIKSFNDERAANVFTALGKIASGGTAKLTVTATPAADGDIYIEGVKMSEGMAGMTFFKGISLALKAVPKKGCTFTSWGGAAAGSADSVNIPLSADQTITATFAGTPSSVKPSAIRENPSLYCHDRAVAVNCAIALTVDFSFAAGDHAVINLYNLSGKKIAGLFDSDMSRGVRTISLTSKKLPAGVYFYAIKTNAFTRTNLVTVR